MFLEVKRECSSQALCTAVMKPSWTGLVLFEFEMAFISTIFLSQLCILLIAFFSYFSDYFISRRKSILGTSVS